MENIARKSSFLIVAQTFTKIIAFFYTIFLARNLGVENFGLYTVALSYFSLISSTSDFGISRYFMREASRGQKTVADLISNISMFRLLILTCVILVFSFTIYHADPSKVRASLSILAALAILPTALSWSVNDCFLATSRTKLYSFGTLFLSFATTIAGVILVLGGYSVVGVVFALLIGQYLLAFFNLALFLHQKMRFSRWIRGEIIKEVIFGSLPYGVLGILGLLYFKIDAIMLSYLRGSYEAGIYGAAYKFLDAIVFIPTSVSVVVFPIMSKFHDIDIEKVASLSKKIMVVMGGIGVLVMLGFIFILPFVIRFFLPNYLQSILVVQILSLSIPFMFIHVPLSQALLSSDKYLKPVILLSIFTVSFNIVSNFLLIPTFGYIAASWITVFSDVVSLLGLLFVIRKYIFKNA